MVYLIGGTLKCKIPESERFCVGGCTIIHIFEIDPSLVLSVFLLILNMICHSNLPSYKFGRFYVLEKDMGYLLQVNVQ